MIVLGPGCWNVYKCASGLLNRCRHVFLCPAFLPGVVFTSQKEVTGTLCFYPTKPAFIRLVQSCNSPKGKGVESLMLSIYDDSFSIPINLTFFAIPRSIPCRSLTFPALFNIFLHFCHSPICWSISADIYFCSLSFFSSSLQSLGMGLLLFCFPVSYPSIAPSF